MPRAVRRFLLCLTVVLAALLGAEGAVRLAAAGGWLPSPEPLLWHRREVTVKLQQMERLEAASPIEVLFVGSSFTYTGIDPAVFDQAYTALAGRPIVSYNAGLAALPVSLVDLFVERVFTRYTSPRAIVLVLSPRDLNRNNSLNQSIADEVYGSPYGQALLGDGLPAWAARFLLDHSQLYRYRSVIALAALNGFHFPNPLPLAYDDPDFDPRGYARNEEVLAARVAAGMPFGQTVSDISLRNYDPSGPHTAGLEKLMRFCREQGIRLILVNMPITPYMAASFAHPEQDYQRYLETVTALAERYGVPVWDINRSPERDQFGDDDFSDIFHLNYQGAHKLSRLLAERYAQYDADSSLVR